MRTRKAIPTIELSSLIRKLKVFEEDGSNGIPDVMSVEAMTSDDVLERHNDGNGGMLTYMDKVLKAIKMIKESGYEAVRQAIRQSSIPNA